jgi:hypothetical protein
VIISALPFGLSAIAPGLEQVDDFSAELVAVRREILNASRQDMRRKRLKFGHSVGIKNIRINGMCAIWDSARL